MPDSAPPSILITKDELTAALTAHLDDVKQLMATTVRTDLREEFETVYAQAESGPPRSRLANNTVRVPYLLTLFQFLHKIRG